MSDFPKSVTLVECGPREGFQMETAPVPTGDKVRLIDALSASGISSIEVTSYANPRFVPQMSDASEVAARFARCPGVHYSVLTFNPDGVARARQSGKFDDAGPLLIIASDAVSKSNTNRTTREALAASRPWVEAVRRAGFPFSGVIANAFGCNEEGDVPASRVVSIARAIVSLAGEAGMAVERLGLADTVGAANPLQVRRLVATVREALPEIPLYLHLHDTRGTGMANVLAGLEAGIERFDTSIGGLGGCPYACGAAGNVATEDVVLMCEEMGISTGIDLDRLLDCARLAEQIVGHALPGKAKVGGKVKHTVSKV